MLWNIVYILLVIFLIATLLNLLGVITMAVNLASVIYTLLVITVIVAVLHWIGLF